ncbi:MAG: phenylalanine--tRNA ligase subunit alpha [Patescibacteria group bacterium]
MEEKIQKIKVEAIRDIEKARDEAELFDMEKKYLGRKSAFTEILKSLKDLSPSEKKAIGPLANQAKSEIEKALGKKKKELAGKSEKGLDFDITLPGKKIETGHIHILTQVREEIEDIFLSQGYDIADGPEIETEFYNFDALNIPAHHPARDMQDTFYVKSKGEKLALRSQTSAMQIHYMQEHKPPLRVIAPGKCFRNEAVDSTHEHSFYQFEALVVDKNINVGNLKQVAQDFFSAFFGQAIKVRLRPSYFPFTEPSFEFDISCLVCGGKGCKACRWGGWLELGGAGMVNQNVFVSSGYKRNEWQGFAWGFGLERLAMMKYKIDDVRLFHSGDLRFIKQF